MLYCWWGCRRNLKLITQPSLFQTSVILWKVWHEFLRKKLTALSWSNHWFIDILWITIPLCSQDIPKKPGGQLHSRSVSLISHVPPFIHGNRKQLSVSAFILTFTADRAPAAANDGGYFRSSTLELMVTFLMIPEKPMEMPILPFMLLGWRRSHWGKRTETGTATNNNNKQQTHTNG